jgi:hypothetical protein
VIERISASYLLFIETELDFYGIFDLEELEWPRVDMCDHIGCDEHAFMGLSEILGYTSRGCSAAAEQPLKQQLLLCWGVWIALFLSAPFFQGVG